MNRAKHPLYCPFSDVSRNNICDEFAEEVDCKEVIMKHFIIKNKGSDDNHPLNDALWNEDITRYLMMPHPGTYMSRGSQARAAATQSLV